MDIIINMVPMFRDWMIRVKTEAPWFSYGRVCFVVWAPSVGGKSTNIRERGLENQLRK